MSSNDLNVNYKSVTENFLETIDKHAHMKKKFIRGNQVPFMNRDFQIHNIHQNQTKKLILARSVQRK